MISEIDKRMQKRQLNSMLLVTLSSLRAAFCVKKTGCISLEYNFLFLCLGAVINSLRDRR